MDDKNIYENLRSWRQKLGYIPQSIYLSDDTIRNNVAFGIYEDQIDDDAIWKALEKAQLKDFVHRNQKKPQGNPQPSPCGPDIFLPSGSLQHSPS